jgi:hypothetical protein
MAEFVKVTVMVLLILGAFTNISQIGKPRQPITSGVAAVASLVQMLLAFAIYVHWKL